MLCKMITSLPILDAADFIILKKLVLEDIIDQTASMGARLD